MFYSDNGSTAVEVAQARPPALAESRRARPPHVRHPSLRTTATPSARCRSAKSPCSPDPSDAALPGEAGRRAAFCYRAPARPRARELRIDCLGSLEATLEKAGRSVAAVLVEPMLQAAGGCDRLAERVSRGVRHLCDSYGTLMIADEVRSLIRPTGRGCSRRSMRRSRPTSSLVEGAHRDTCRSVPPSRRTGFEAFLGEDRAKTFFHAIRSRPIHWRAQSPLASLDLFREHDVLTGVIRLEARLRAGCRRSPICRAWAMSASSAASVSLELVSDKSTRKSDGYLDGIGPRLSAMFLDRGLLLRPLGNVVLCRPTASPTIRLDWALTRWRPF